MQLSTHPDEDQTGLAEQQIDDKVFMINPVGDSGRIWVLHQAAARYLRKDMAATLRRSVKELEAIENDDFLKAVEEHAVTVEKNFVKMFSSDATSEYDELRTRFLGSPAPLPTFDFEIN